MINCKDRRRPTEKIPYGTTYSPGAPAARLDTDKLKCGASAPLGFIENGRITASTGQGTFSTAFSRHVGQPPGRFALTAGD